MKSKPLTNDEIRSRMEFCESERTRHTRLAEGLIAMGKPESAKTLLRDAEYDAQMRQYWEDRLEAE